MTESCLSLPGITEPPGSSGPGIPSPGFPRSSRVRCMPNINQLYVAIEKRRKPFGFLTFSFTCSLNVMNSIVFETIVSDIYGLIINLVLGFIIELIGRICRIKKCNEKTIIKILYWYIKIGSRLIIAFMLIYFITILAYCFHYRPLFD
jgi:hypothetical protein